MPAFSASGALHLVASMNPFPMKSALSGLVGSLDKFTGAIRLAGVGIAILAGVKMVQATREAERFEMQVANLAKLLGRPAAEPLANSISHMSRELPVARERLFEVAEVAARLGIRGSQNIKMFVETMALIDVTTDMSATAAANAFARIAAVTQQPISAVRSMANVINTLSNRTATSFSEIVTSAGELAPVLTGLGASTTEIFAIAAATNEVNISVRRGARRMRSFFQQLSDPKKIEVFAKTLNMTRGEFEAFIREGDGAVALLGAVTKILRDGGEAADVWRGEMMQAGRQGMEGTANNMEGLNEIIEWGNEALAKNNSLWEEYGEFADTAIAMSIRTQNAMGDMNRMIGEAFLPIKKMWLDIRLDAATFWGDIIATSKYGVAELGRVLDDENIANFRKQIRELLVTKSPYLEGLKFEPLLGDIDKEALEFLTDQIATLSTLDPTLIPTYLLGVSRGLETMADEGAATSEILDIMSESYDRVIAAFRERGGLPDELFAQDKKIRGESYEMFRLLPILAKYDHDWKSASDQLKEAAKAHFLLNVRMNEGAVAMRREELMFEGLGHAEAEDIALMERMTEVRDKLIVTDEDREKSAERIRKKFQSAHVKEMSTWAEKVEVWIKAGDITGKLAEDLRVLALAQDETDRVNKAADDADKLTEAFNKEKDSLIELRKKYEGGAEAVREFKWEVAGFNLVQREELRLYWEKAEAARLTREEIDKAAKAQEQWNEKLASLKERADFSNIETQVRFFSNLARETSKAFLDTFEGIADGSENAGEAVIDMLHRISREAIETWLTLQLFQGIFDFAGAGNIADTVAKKSIARSGFFFASGGRIKKGQLSIVGEEGPEFFVPSASGSIVPNNKITSGVTVVQNITFSPNFIDGASGRMWLETEGRASIQQVMRDSLQDSQMMSRAVRKGRVN